MIAKTYPFEGQQLTIADIRRRVPILGDKAVRSRLADGCDSRQKMLAWDQTRALREAGRLGRAAAEANGNLTRLATFGFGSMARARAAAAQQQGEDGHDG